MHAFFLAVALESAPISAWSDEPLSIREALASKIVSNPATQFDQEEFEAAMTDAAARPLFKKIRTDTNWGPEHPTWRQLFPEFNASFRNFTKGLSFGVEERLKMALATALTETELSEIVATLSDAKYLDNLKIMKQLGIDSASVMRIMGIVTTPALYSQAEKESLKEKFSGLKGRERELETLKPRIDAALKSVQTPAFTNYQRVLAAVLSELLRSLETDDSARQQMRSLIVTWQDRVKQY
jgi:hypothetical protein